MKVKFYLYISIHNKKNGNSSLKPLILGRFKNFQKV